MALGNNTEEKASKWCLPMDNYIDYAEYIFFTRTTLQGSPPALPHSGDGTQCITISTVQFCIWYPVQNHQFCTVPDLVGNIKEGTQKRQPNWEINPETSYKRLKALNIQASPPG